MPPKGSKAASPTRRNPSRLVRAGINNDNKGTSRRSETSTRPSPQPRRDAAVPRPSRGLALPTRINRNSGAADRNDDSVAAARAAERSNEREDSMNIDNSAGSSPGDSSVPMITTSDGRQVRVPGVIGRQPTGPAGQAPLPVVRSVSRYVQTQPRPKERGHESAPEANPSPATGMFWVVLSFICEVPL
eukprot:GHVU01043180.1.p2 GENE.GHVU01043180.1~~GHVU01043180.1.p2  ORF type:complete len:188 (+),score=7.66 GHVU01043180.1:242-805(+)